MSLRHFLPLLLLLISLPVFAQTDKSEKPEDPLAMPLPEGITSAVRFTIGGDLMVYGDRDRILRSPMLARISADRHLHRLDLIMRDLTGDSSRPRIAGQLRIVLLFTTMESFTAWYGRRETSEFFTELRNLGVRNLGTKFENIRPPASALVSD